MPALSNCRFHDQPIELITFKVIWVLCVALARRTVIIETMMTPISLTVSVWAT